MYSASSRRDITMRQRTMHPIRFLVILAAILLLLAFNPQLTQPVDGVADNGTGHIWLTSGLNGTGEARDFNIGPDQTYNLTGLRYQQNCSGTCDFLANTVSSVIFSCGVSGSPIDQNDTIRFYDIYPNVGINQLLDPNYPGSCVNGTIKMNLTTLDNKADSAITNE